MNAADADLRAAIEAAADLLADSQDPWWIIAGAAAALHGVSHIPVGDVDILVSRRDAAAIGKRPGVVERRKETTPLFRSDSFLHYRGAPLEIEIMAGFRIKGEDGFTEVTFAAREGVTVGGRRVFVPSKTELARFFERMGRPKDLSRAKALLAAG